MRQIELLGFAIDKLERLAIPYAVVGSHASSAWGEPRMTRDIDILISLAADQVGPLCDAFPSADFYVSRPAAVEAVERNTQFNVIHPESGNKIDFMVAADGAWSTAQLKRRKKVNFDSAISGYVAAPEDVILGKLIYYQEGGSEKHLRDIRGILKISGDVLDHEYLARNSASIGVSDIWKALNVDSDSLTFLGSMLLAYNTNGLAHHDQIDAIGLLADIGYAGIAITLDHGTLNPYDERLEEQLDRVRSALEKHRLRCVIETGARFLLDARTKHEPTLVTADAAGRARRVDFLCRAIDIASRLNADCVSLWSGIERDGAGESVAFSRLVEGLTLVLSEAQRKGVVLAFEPEPGMLVATLDDYERLLDELSAKSVDASRLRLTIDVGHLHCQGELPIPDKIHRWRNNLSNVHIEDMRAGVHEHLMFGEGEIDFRPVIAALIGIEYDGLLSVELSRHSHEGPEAARRAYNFLWPLVARASGAKK